MKPELENYVRAWFEKAEHDLLSAERLIEIKPSILDTACFHCQQTVEKYLKGLLVANGIEPEHTHHIPSLLKACSEIDPVFASIDAKSLDNFSVIVRYPHNAELPELGEAKGFLELAKNIKAMVLERVGINIIQAQPLKTKKNIDNKLLSKKVKKDNPLLPKRKSNESLLPKNRVRKSKGKGL